jgi:hypothetical protein
MIPSDFQRRKDTGESGFAFTKIVEVTDGRLTMSFGLGCLNTHGTQAGASACDQTNTVYASPQPNN